jgi:hypothetical protein
MAHVQPAKRAKPIIVSTVYFLPLPMPRVSKPHSGRRAASSLTPNDDGDAIPTRNRDDGKASSHNGAL